MKPSKRSQKCSIVNKTVSFNVEDPYQAQLLEAVNNLVNFSSAVKRWIANGMPGAGSLTVATREPAVQPMSKAWDEEPVPTLVRTSEAPVVEFDAVSAFL